MGFIAPLFAQYPLGEKYTEWLYGDPQSNPYWDRPEKWSSQSAMVSRQDRVVQITKLQFAGPRVGGTQFVDLSLTGGRNCVIFARYAAVTYNQDPPPVSPAPTPAQQLPTQLWNYTLIGQRTVEGYREIDEGTPIANVFGTQPWPHRFPVPMMWNDKLRRVLKLEYIADLDDAVDISLVWELAWLNTGA